MNWEVILSSLNAITLAIVSVTLYGAAVTALIQDRHSVSAFTGLIAVYLTRRAVYWADRAWFTRDKISGVDHPILVFLNGFALLIILLYAIIEERSRKGEANDND